MNKKLMIIIMASIFGLGYLISHVMTNGHNFTNFEFVEISQILVRAILVLPLLFISIILVISPLLFSSKREEILAKEKLIAENERLSRQLAQAEQKVVDTKPPEPSKLSLPQSNVNGSWSNLVEECVALFEEIERNKKNFNDSRLDLAEHFTDRLREILEISDVDVISEETQFDRLRHQPEGTLSTSVEQGTQILQTLSPGFAIDKRILRRAKVRVAFK